MRTRVPPASSVSQEEFRDVPGGQGHDPRTALAELLAGDTLTTDGPVIGVYRITRDGQGCTGLLADVALAAYEQGAIRGHEHTRAEMEEALVAELDEIEAIVGPVVLAHRPERDVRALLDQHAEGEPAATWRTVDGVQHEVWLVVGEQRDALLERCAALDPLYIVDGHHRLAAAARRAAARRDDTDAWSAFLAAIFSSDLLEVRAYHRMVDLPDRSAGPELLQRLQERFVCEPVAGLEEARPHERGALGVGLAGRWYRVRLDGLGAGEGEEERTDVHLLDELVLEPLLGVGDPRTDSRIHFVPDVGDPAELARRCTAGAAVCFLLNPMRVEEVLAVADEGSTLPPKSTWFEPKPVTGVVLPTARLSGLDRSAP